MKRRNKLGADGSMTFPSSPLSLIGMLCGSLWLSACGGGSESPSPPPPPATTALPDLDIVAPATADLGAAVAISTSVPPAAALKAQWDFGDGTTATDAAPQHQFARAGDLTVKLTLTNETGAQKSYTKAISLTNKVLVKGNYCSGNNDQGWCWMPPQASGNTIRDIQFVDANHGWRSDVFGDVFNTTDGGRSWKRQTTGVSADLSQIIVHSLQDIVAVSPASNLLVISEDGGKNWHKQTLPITGNSTVVHALGQGRVLVRRHAWIEGSETAHYLDRATGSWQPVALGIHDQISVGPDGSILTYSARQVMRRNSPLADPVLVFTAPALPEPVNFDRMELSRTQDQVVWLMRVFGNSSYSGEMRLYRSVNGGQQWDPNPITLGGSVSTSCCQIPTVQASDALGTKLAIQTYMSGSLGGTAREAVWYSGDGGGTWTMKVKGSIYPYATAWCEPSHASLLVCYSALDSVTASASVSRDYGLTRTPVPLSLTGVAEAPRDLAGAALLVNSWLGIAIASAELSEKWPLFAALEKPLGFYPGKPTFPATVPSFGSRKVARRVLNGTLFATDDGGRSWTALGQLLSADGKDMVGLAEQKTAAQAVTRLKSASMVDDRTTLLVTSAGQVAMSNDAGATWTRPEALNQAGLAIEQLQFQDSNLGWALGRKDSAARLFLTRDGGKTWRNLDAVPTAAPLAMLVGAGQEVTVVGTDGAVHRSTNDGASWASPGNAGNPLTHLFFGRDGATYWATGNTGAVFKSADKGVTWQKTQLATTANLLAVCFAEGNNGWASGQAGQMWATRDGGTTWRAQSTPATQDLTTLNCQDGRTVWAAGSAGLLATGTGGE